MTELIASHAPAAALPADGLPLTAGQSAIWFGQAAHRASSVYQCAEFVEFEGELDPDLLARTIAECLTSLTAFSAAFRPGTEGEPRMVPERRTHPVRRVTLPPGEDPLDWAAAQSRVPAMTGPDEALTGEELSGQTLVRLPEGRWAWLARFHHILGDGYAFHALIRWVGECYAAALDRTAPPPAPFADPLRNRDAEAEYAHAEQARKDREHWRTVALPEDPPGLGRGRAPASEETLSAEAVLEAADRRALRELARSFDLGEVELLAAAVGHYAALLGGAEEVVLGVPLLNRIPGEPIALEPRVNVLPLAVPTGIGVEPHDHLQEVSARLAALRSHGRCRAEQIRRERGVTDPAQQLTGPGLNIKPFASRFRFGSLEARLTTIALGPVEDLDVMLQARGDGGFTVRVLANPARHDARGVAAHARRLTAFLTAFARSEGRLTALPLVLPEERRQVLEEFNDTAHALDLPESTTLCSLVLERRTDDLHDAARAAEPALLHEGQALSRRELWTEIDALSARLRALGVGPGSLVAVQLRRGPALPIALAAIVAAGAGWLPMDPDLPPARRALMLRTGAPVAVVAGREPLPDPQEDPEGAAAPPPVIELDERALRPATEARLCADGPAAADARPGPGDLAYAIFTSGSTGTPKGVEVPHGAIVNRLLWMAEHYGIGPADTILQKTPCSFDVSVWEFFLPFVTGARIAVAADGAHRDPAAIARELRSSHATVCHFVPSALKAFLDGGPGPDGVLDLPDLEQVFCSGEALEPGLVRRFHAAHGARLHNLYGPTEAAVDVTAHTCVPGEDEVPIGAPVWNTRTYVLDPARRPLPSGFTGELFLAGAQLARGYRGREDLTAERFVADPFHPGERMYATGDIARWRDDGEIVYYGRADSQVKIRGLRIELGEIESVLAELPQVRQCAVLCQELAGEQVLVGYIVPAGDVPDTGELPPELGAEIRARLAARLPDYMVPGVLLPVPALPTTVNGKLDASRLPAPRQRARAVALPRDPLEHSVARSFGQVLEMDAVSMDDSFFDLGGTSLSAVRLARALAQATGTELGVAEVFGSPSPHAMAARIRGDDAADPFAPLFTLRGHRGGTPLVCAPPAGGLGWAYAGLLPWLPRERGVFALQAPGLRDPAERAGSIAELAGRYADLLPEAVHGAPEVDLLGWSVGGVIAHELAIVLAARGTRVRRLVLLDAYPGELWRSRPAPDLAERLQGMLVMAGIDADALEGAEPTVETVVAAVRRRGSVFASLPAEILAGVTETVGHSARLMREHATGMFEGPAVFVKAERNPEALDETAWTAHLDGMRVHRLSCTHPQMVAPEQLRAVAQLLD